MSQHVVLLEAGRKQAFIFGTNKQAVNVGASELIRSMGENWVREAIAQIAQGGNTEDWELVCASGKAVLVVPDADTGRAIVRAVTTRALRDAPGLVVCGVVVLVTEGLGAAVKLAHQRHRTVRTRLAPVELRQPTLPYVQPCQYSGLPATTMGREGDQNFPRAQPVHAAWRRGGAGRARMARYLTDEAVLSADRLDRGVTNAGWIAVVHADGNDIGALFSGLPASYPDDEEYRRVYRSLSESLDTVTRAALRSAVNTKPDRANWILPIVVGGDDVTAIMDARLAFEVTRTFLERFEMSSHVPAITDVLRKVRGDQAGPDGLTAAAGIAFVKPHHPFSDAYRLAEELCESAKTLKHVNGGHSAVDFHVLHDSVGRSLEALRAEQISHGDDDTELRRWAGPYLVGGPTRSVDHLLAAMDDLRRDGDRPPALSVGAVLRLREALIAGGPRIDRERDQVIAWSEDTERARDYLDAHLRRTPETTPDTDGLLATPFTRIVDALHLLDMERGTIGEGDRS